jgi:hypothetical protein
MRHVIQSLLAVSLLVGTTAMAAELTATCPTVMRYEDGSQLRFNDRFYYPGGAAVNLGQNVFYPNGQSLMRGTIYSYPTGQTLMTSNATYYPNGTNLAFAGNVYWADGSNLRWGGNYYYDDGAPARVGNTLYLPSGQRTRFPLRLEEDIGTYGVMRANVAELNDNVELVFDRLVSESGVRVQLLHASGQQQPTVEVSLDVGSGVETVRLTFQGNYVVRCDLVAGSPSRFSIEHPVADLDVSVRPGHDPQEVGAALLDALDGVGARR